MRAGLVAALLLLMAPAGAAAAPELVPVGTFSDPVALAAPPRDASRLFVVQRGGIVRLIKDGVTLPAPFADLTTPVLAGGERGLLGMAFPPDYATSGLAYVFLTAESPAGELQIRELRRSADPDRAVPGAGRLVLAVPHPDTNHNGGQLAFGPDGMLYAATGDGGGSNDLENDAAETDSLLGKILRINPREGGAQPENPFGNAVWAYGLRNPWRFSFDRATGDLVIGDVGQGVKEEVDWAPASAGRGRGVDFGWHCWEGTIPTPVNPNDRESAPLCPAAIRPDSQPPALERDHDDTASARSSAGSSCAIPGLPSLAGRYLFGDNCHSGLESAVLGAPEGPVDTGLAVAALTSFGEDACGRIHTASLDGTVSRLQDGAPSPCSFPPEPGAPGGALPPGAGAGHAGAAPRDLLPRHAAVPQAAARAARGRGLHGDAARQALPDAARRAGGRSAAHRPAAGDAQGRPPPAPRDRPQRPPQDRGAAHRARRRRQRARPPRAAGRALRVTRRPRGRAVNWRRTASRPS